MVQSIQVCKGEELIAIMWMKHVVCCIPFSTFYLGGTCLGVAERLGKREYVQNEVSHIVKTVILEHDLLTLSSRGTDPPRARLYTSP